jgi:hypothetical protein
MCVYKERDRSNEQYWGLRFVITVVSAIKSFLNSNMIDTHTHTHTNTNSSAAEYTYVGKSLCFSNTLEVRTFTIFHTPFFIIIINININSHGTLYCDVLGAVSRMMTMMVILVVVVVVVGIVWW